MHREDEALHNFGGDRVVDLQRGESRSNRSTVMCPKCRLVLSAEAVFCRECGFKLPDKTDQLFKSLSERIKRPILKSEREAFTLALEMLERGDFITWCVDHINKYHAGDTTLARLLLVSALRVSFHSSSALLHYSVTGASGSGKSDLYEKICAIIPSNHLEVMTSVTPQVLYYATLSESNDGQRVTNPEAFSGKVIVVTEINDSRSFSALKAFAEQSEISTFTHKVTIGGTAKDLIVRGARAVFCASVMPINDEQAANRFIDVSISKSDMQAKVDKAALACSNVLNEATIETDPQSDIAKAGVELLMSGDSEFEEPTEEVKQLVKDTSAAMTVRGISLRKVKQLYSLAQCCAVEKSWRRGELRVEVEDVKEACELLKPWLVVE